MSTQPKDQHATTRHGRPRTAEHDAAILDATLSLLIEVGYDRLSIESVAARAGVSRPTVYRRFADKAALVSAAVQRREPGTRPEADSGDLRTDLLQVLRWLSQEIAEQQAGLLGAMFVGMRNDPDLAAAMREVLQRDQATMTDQPLGAATRRGEQLVPRAAELFAEIAPAVLVHRLLVGDEPCDQSFLEHLVDDILVRLMTCR